MEAKENHLAAATALAALFRGEEDGEEDEDEEEEDEEEDDEDDDYAPAAKKSKRK